MIELRNWLLALAVLLAIGAALIWTWPWSLLVLAVGPLAVGAALARDRWRASRARRAFLAAHPGKRILFVYSASPNWQAYIEDRWLPLLRDRGAILNWSERQEWPMRHPIEAAVFRAYAGPPPRLASPRRHRRTDMKLGRM